jgi:hypothetical protein
VVNENKIGPGQVWPDHSYGLPPDFHVDWSKLEAIAGQRELPVTFKGEFAARAWLILKEAWRDEITLRKKVNADWRKLRRRRNPLIQRLARFLAPSPPLGRPLSDALFDDLICWLDLYFSDLECKTNPWKHPQCFEGRMVDLVYEIVQQMKPMLHLSRLLPGASKVIGFPTGINVFRRDLQGNDRQAELNTIGRRIKKVREENTKRYFRLGLGKPSPTPW